MPLAPLARWTALVAALALAPHAAAGGLDGLMRLRERRPRVERYGWDKDHDWRNKPILY